MYGCKTLPNPNFFKIGIKNKKISSEIFGLAKSAMAEKVH
jgi:hypothetical protein